MSELSQHPELESVGDSRTIDTERGSTGSQSRLSPAQAVSSFGGRVIRLISDDTARSKGTIATTGFLLALPSSIMGTAFSASCARISVTDSAIIVGDPAFLVLSLASLAQSVVTGYVHYADYGASIRDWMVRKQRTVEGEEQVYELVPVSQMDGGD